MNSMNAKELRDLLQRTPFQPFRVILTSGTTYEIHNPEMAALLPRVLFVALPSEDRYATVPLMHIASIEVMQPV
jgi:hypothetical protein